MDALPQAASALLSPAVIAAFGPSGAVLLFFSWMLISYLRGREERQARVNEEMAKSLRENEREIFERQKREIEGLRVDIAALEARLNATERLCEKLRQQAFSTYVLCRENTHAAVNARQALIVAKLKQAEDFMPLTWPEPPPLD